jgi:hypothetical protein
MAAENPAQLVCSREEFDFRLKSNKSLRGVIAGASSFSLTHLQAGITPLGYSVPLFSPWNNGCAYADLHPDVYKAVFNETPGYSNDNFLFNLNRRYGKRAAIVEYAMQQSFAPETALDLYLEYSEHMTELVETLRDFGPEKLKTINPYKYLPSDFNHEAESAMRGVFPRRRDLIKAITSLRNREGVQVFYQDRSKFADFLKEASAKPVDDCSVEFYQPVPVELVLAVIPLGQYEKRALGISS